MPFDNRDKNVKAATQIKPLAKSRGNARQAKSKERTVGGCIRCCLSRVATSRISDGETDGVSTTPDAYGLSCSIGRTLQPMCGDLKLPQIMPAPLFTIQGLHADSTLRTWADVAPGEVEGP